MTDTVTTGRGVRRGRRALLGIMAIAAVGAGFWWWSHPTFFDDFNGSYESPPRSVADAEYSFAVTFPPTGDEASGDVRVDDARVHFVRNTAAATVSFSVCHLSPSEDPIGAVHDADKSCADHEPLRSGMTIRKGTPDSEAPGDYVFVTVTPIRAGVARIDRVDLDYALGADHLWRRGTEPLGMDVTITAR